MQVEELVKQGTEAIKKLRVEKLASGEFFMINAPELPEGQSYIEYPDANIALVSLNASEKDFVVLKTLTENESYQLRKRYDFI